MVDIKGYEGRYAITTDGQIWSYKYNNFLTPYDHKNGYKMVILYNDEGEYKRLYVHRLVAQTYIPNPLNLPEVDHINSNKEENTVENLQWITKEDNIKKAKCKKVRCIELDRVFNSQKEAALILHLEQGNISRVCNGKARTTGGYHFEFVLEGDE